MTTYKNISTRTSAVVQTQYVSSGTRVSTTHTSFAEPSSSYRVSITPFYSNSMIEVSYYIPLNQSSAANILTILRSFRIIDGGSKSYSLTSTGASNGSRNVIAGGVFRPQNGYDGNDMDMKMWTVIDFPGTTGTCTYGFESRPEGGNTTYWGYSGGDSSLWGWDSDIVIVAREIAQ
jgi:hypothetical protein